MAIKQLNISTGTSVSKQSGSWQISLTARFNPALHRSGRDTRKYTQAGHRYLVQQQVRAGQNGTEQRWQEIQQGKGKVLWFLVGEERYAERKETELGYSALLGCWKSLTCLLQDSGLLRYPWGDHLLTQTGPAIHRRTRKKGQKSVYSPMHHMETEFLRIQLHSPPQPYNEQQSTTPGFVTIR